MAVAVLIGAFGGREIDDWLDTSPFFLILGFIFGVAAGFLNVYRLTTPKRKDMIHSKNYSPPNKDTER